MIDFPIRKYMKKKWRARPRARARVFFQDVVEFAGGIRRQKLQQATLQTYNNIQKHAKNVRISTFHSFSLKSSIFNTI